MRTERYSVIEGRTPEITVEQSLLLLAAIRLETIADYRDRALIAALIYTGARAGAVAGLRLRDFMQDGTQFVLRFAEKGGKARSIPVRHDLQGYIDDYVLISGVAGEPKESPLFRSIGGPKCRLTTRPLSGVDVCRLAAR